MREPLEARPRRERLLDAVERGLEWLAVPLLFCGTASLVLMAMHVIADVTGRILLSTPVYGTTEIVSFYYMVAAVCLPLAYIELRDEHITVDVIYQQFPPLARRMIFVFSTLATALFFGLFAYQSWLDAMKAMGIREMMMGSAMLEIWPSRFFLPISFGLLTLVALLRAAKTVLAPALAEEHARPTIE
jgi:TRAP-type C4-dicarboxylate transport system permease small subunit